SNEFGLRGFDDGLTLRARLLDDALQARHRLRELRFDLGASGGDAFVVARGACGGGDTVRLRLRLREQRLRARRRVAQHRFAAFYRAVDDIASLAAYAFPVDFRNEHRLGERRRILERKLLAGKRERAVRRREAIVELPAHRLQLLSLDFRNRQQIQVANDPRSLDNLTHWGFAPIGSLHV
ncbi:MAG TPA: hypothetical protein VHZ95_21100, partial [Polyangiales bacterium]|nr:hypothetical protein [Polyangiales bacterium]